MQKVVLITGGTGYVGSAIAKELEHRGWFVAKLSRSSIDFPCDVTDRASVQRAVQKVVDTHKVVTAVIHASSPPLERVSPAQASRQSVELHTAVAVEGIRNLFNATQSYIPKEGIFIGITTDATKSPSTLALGGYVKAKRTMEEFLQKQIAPFRVCTFSIGFLPGGLNSDLPEQARTFFAAKSESIERVAERIADLCES